MDVLNDLPEIEITSDCACIRVPKNFYLPELLTNCLKGAHKVCSWELRGEGALQVLTIRSRTDNVEEAVCEVFSALHGYPFFPRSELNAFENSVSPLMSCVLLLTANDLFVANHLVPSIIASSKGFPIEIVIVYNGLDADLDFFRGYDVSSSEFGCVSKGYNQGVSRCKGRYIAIFHDDCILADPDWIPKCIALLQDGYLAVSPEIHRKQLSGAHEAFVVAKNVPLVMERGRFFDLGGYDELYYIGYEDYDLTYQILSNGHAFSPVPLNYFHLSGMSTVLMFGGQRERCKQLFALNLLPIETICALRDSSLLQLMRSETSSWIQTSQFNHFLSKFEHYLCRTGHRSGVPVCGPPAGELGDSPLARNRKAMIDFVRQSAARCGR